MNEHSLLVILGWLGATLMAICTVLTIIGLVEWIKEVMK